MRSVLLVCGSLFAGLLSTSAQSTAIKPKSCAELASLPLDHAKVSSAQVNTAGSAVPDVKLPPIQVRSLPAFCRVVVHDHPSSDSDIRTEIWLPLAGFNGRLAGFGNGGFAGEIYYTQLAAAVAEGYAAVGTDTGHTGGDAGFALHHPEKVTDFGWRAIHDMTLEAKQIEKAFYGSPATHAYFNGCSDGGREALMEAERFPQDYDGILAGAPAYNWSGLVSAGAVAAYYETVTPGGTLPASKIPALAAAVRNACDAQDGVKDGILNDPRTCHFDPATLACKQGDADTCLTQPQVELVKLLYSEKDDTHGNKVLPGYMPGAEDAKGGWIGWIVPEDPAKGAIGDGFVNGYFRDFVYGQPDWSVRSFNLDRDLAAARQKTGAALDATDTNLTPFFSRGGKLMLYHGWNDPAIPPLSTVDYFNGVESRVGRQQAEASMRLYLVPGMLHCSGGPGAYDLGQFGGAPGADAQKNAVAALEHWVEAGQVPGQITSRNGSLTRPLCPYPQEAKYNSGDPNLAGSFSCVEGPR